jgi:hypothetical protein
MALSMRRIILVLAVGVRPVREDLSSKATKELGACRVRSGTDDPCPRPAAVRIGGVPLCAGCARDQEAYFAIGKLTEEPRSLHDDDDERLVVLLGRMRQIGAGRSVTDAHEHDTAQSTYSEPSPRTYPLAT